MGSYYDDYYNKNLKKTQDEIKKQQTQNTTTSNAYVADLNAIVDKNISNSVNKVQGEIDKLPTQYQSGFDANAIQQKINERQVAERMANMGMTNSGLNRTQQTAINIQRSNADAALRTQINSATNSLKQQIADLYASGESQKAENSAKARYELEQKNQAVYENMMNNLYSSSSAYEKAMIEADAKAEEARIKAAQEQEKWYLQNGYAKNANGQWQYVGKNRNSKTFTMDEYDSALETAIGLYNPDYGANSPQNANLLAYMERLAAMGYDEAVLDDLLLEVVANASKPKEIPSYMKPVVDLFEGIKSNLSTTKAGASNSGSRSKNSSSATGTTTANRRKQNHGKG